jgi:low temperature requirement protein LtrA
MTRHTRGTLILTLTALAGEIGCQMSVMDANTGNANVVLLAFLAGPLLFLAMIAWRRRAHASRSRVLFFFALAVAIGGLLVFGNDCYRYHTEAAYRLKANMKGLMVPIAQWVVILAAWLWLLLREAREKSRV